MIVFDTEVKKDVRENERARLRLRLGDRVSELSRIVDALDTMKRQLSFSERDFLTARLCAEEVFTNIVRHGFTDDRDHEVCLELEADADTISMEFCDTGKPFNPLE